jgi:hypothetical protein
MGLREDISANESNMDTAVSTAIGNWSGTAVYANSFLGGVDPAQVIGAINNINGVAVAKWKARGEAFVQNPGTADQGALTKWVNDGNGLQKQIYSIADMSSESSIVSMVATVTSQTAATVAAPVVNLAKAGAQAWMFFGDYTLWVAGGVGLLLVGIVLWRFSGAVKMVAG